jgi:glycosyltransferase involved in cell wall biosynthesis
MRLKTEIIGKERADHFIALYVGRNAIRKMPNDIIISFKMFLDELEKNHGHRKATLVLHTDPLDPEGPNLHHIIDMLHVKNNIVFSKDRIEFGQMNALYNVSDVLINMSKAEGFGLPVLEMKMTERLVIAIKTGGLTRQVEDHETGTQFGVAMDPDVKMMVGTQMVPYIYEDAVAHETVRDAFTKVYEMGSEERKRLGKLAREHALKNYNIDKLIVDWDTSLTKLVADWREKKLPCNKRWECKEI